MNPIAYAEILRYTADIIRSREEYRHHPIITHTEHRWFDTCPHCQEARRAA